MRAISDHLLECAECRAELAAMMSIIEAARSIEQVEPPKYLRSAIFAATTHCREESATLPAKLRKIFAPAALRWAGSFAGAAAVVAVVLTSLQNPKAPERSVTSNQSPAQKHVQVVADRPEPITKTIAANTAASNYNKIIAAKNHKRYTATARATRSFAPPTVLTSKAAHKPAQSAHDMNNLNTTDAMDDTTVAQTVTPDEIIAKQPVEAKADPTKTRLLVKVASMPLQNEEEAAELANDAKTAAKMRRNNSNTGISLINARF